MSPLQLTTVFQVVDFIRRRFGVTIAQLESHARPAHLIVPRWICVHMCREFAGLSQPDLGLLFDRSHASISRILADLAMKASIDPKLDALVKDCVHCFRTVHGVQPVNPPPVASPARCPVNPVSTSAAQAAAQLACA